MKISHSGSQRLRTLRIWMGLLFICLIVFNRVFKEPVSDDAGRQLRRQLAGQADYIGRPAPDFSIPCMDGSTFRLADALGDRVVVLNFFTTWCGPCRQEIPELNLFYDEYRTNHVVMLGIAVAETFEQVSGYVKQLGLTFPVALDEGRALAGRYGVNGFPTTVVIGPDGNIDLYEVGAIANANVTLVPVVGLALKEAPVPFNRARYERRHAGALKSWQEVGERAPVTTNVNGANAEEGQP